MRNSKLTVEGARNSFREALLMYLLVLVVDFDDKRENGALEIPRSMSKKEPDKNLSGVFSNSMEMLRSVCARRVCRSGRRGARSFRVLIAAGQHRAQSDAQ